MVVALLAKPWKGIRNKKKILQSLLVCKNLEDYQAFINSYTIKILSLDVGEKEEKEKYKELLKNVKDKEIELSSKNLDKDDKKPVNNTVATNETKKPINKVVNQVKEKSEDTEELFGKMYNRLNSSKNSNELNIRFKEKKFQDGLRTVSADEKKQLIQLRESLIVEFNNKNKGK